MVLVPYLLLKDRLRSYGETITSNEVGLTLITKIGIVLQECFEAVLARLELTVAVPEHPDSSTCVDDQHLAVLLTN
jgi:hypothetical protein